MKSFTFHNFDVTIEAHDGGYLYLADNGSHEIADPSPEYRDGLYPTVNDAAEAAKQAIFIYEVTSMLIELPSLEQNFIRNITQRIFEGDWKVSSESELIEKVLEEEGIRRRQ